MLKETLEEHIDPEWTSNITPKYKVYDLESGPHCDQARTYRQMGGKLRYTCTHPCNEHGEIIDGPMPRFLVRKEFP